MRKKADSHKKKPVREWKPLCADVEIHRFEDDAPTRNVLNGRRTLVVCDHYSHKMRTHVPCEGRGEENAARTLDCIRPAQEFFGQDLIHWLKGSP
jgi:hypothetical protein